MGIRTLLNESDVIERDNEHLYLGGIDDAHRYLGPAQPERTWII